MVLSTATARDKRTCTYHNSTSKKVGMSLSAFWIAVIITNYNISLRRGNCNSSSTDSNSSAPSIITSLARPKDFFISFLIGSLSCDCGSLVGMGGGFIFIPIMTTLFGLLQHAADGTLLLAVATIGLAGAVR
jgi:hypothetical protein